jgi:1,2-diacylglycerol 3-alpha-glucosyltransferase
MGVKDVLREGAGALIAQADLEDFAAKTLRLLRDRELNRRLRVAAVAYAQDWTAPALAARLLDYYRRLVAPG